MPNQFANSSILLWHMGNVGSTSVCKALQNTKRNITQVQSLDLDRIDRLIREYESRGMVVPDHIYDALKYRTLIANPREKLRVISFVRDPIARNFSELFESSNVYPPIFDEKSGPSKLAEWFFMNFDYSILRWFDHEIYRETGINIYHNSFDHDKRRLLIETDNIDIIVMRFEDAVEDKERNIKNFLQISEPSLYINYIKNTIANNSLRNSMKFLSSESSSILERVYCSKMVEHFYTADEIDRFRRSWSPFRD